MPKRGLDVNKCEIARYCNNYIYIYMHDLFVFPVDYEAKIQKYNITVIVFDCYMINKIILDQDFMSTRGQKLLQDDFRDATNDFFSLLITDFFFPCVI